MQRPPWVNGSTRGRGTRSEEAGEHFAARQRNGASDDDAQIREPSAAGITCRGARTIRIRDGDLVHEGNVNGA
jgi:hypothetical protein